MTMRRTVFGVVVLTVLAACDQNSTRVATGDRIEDAPPIAIDPEAKPLAGAVQPPSGGEIPGMEGRVPPFLKVFFMHQFVEALYSTPQNKQPNPQWQSPLKDPVNGRVWCTDCHGDNFDFSKMPKQRMPATDGLENDHEFMVELMTKWVGRLNSDQYRARAKLKGPVQCTTCHAVDPRKE
jgi:hypothetical protein